ncbi:helix-turn-helix domain-containing protein, partial [Streptococcus anginosus]
MSTLLATRLKSKRLELGVSQKELAEGVCEQGQISRMEKGKYMPGSDLLYSLSKKMNVPMNYFFDDSVLGETSKLVQFKELVESFLVKREYDSLKYLYSLEIDKQHRLPLSDQNYLEWIGAIVSFHCDNKREEAIKKLEQMLVRLSKDELMYLRISNTLLNFFLEEKNNDEFEKCYQAVLAKLQSIDFTHTIELKIYIKIRYNFCRYLWKSFQIEKGIEETLDVIEKCNEYSCSYLLADLYCILANISEDFSSQ